MNGFDKGLEGLSSKNANPITDSMALRGLQYFSNAFPELRHSNDPSIMDRCLTGTILVKHGGTIELSSMAHAYGHSLRRHIDIQQGIAHAVMIPHVLGYVFDNIDGRREMLAGEVVGENDLEDPSEAIVDAVTDVRDSLGLPSRLRDVYGVSKSGLQTVAEMTYGDDLVMSNGPSDLDPSIDELEAVLWAAW